MLPQLWFICHSNKRTHKHLFLFIIAVYPFQRTKQPFINHVYNTVKVLTQMLTPMLPRAGSKL